MQWCRGRHASCAVGRRGKGGVLAAKAAERRGKGGVLAAKAVETRGKGGVLAAKAVETQGKGGVLMKERQWKGHLLVDRCQLVPLLRHRPRNLVHQHLPASGRIEIEDDRGCGLGCPTSLGRAAGRPPAAGPALLPALRRGAGVPVGLARRHGAEEQQLEQQQEQQQWSISSRAAPPASAEEQQQEHQQGALARARWPDRPRNAPRVPGVRMRHVVRHHHHLDLFARSFTS